MNIETLKNEIEKIRGKLTNIEEMIADYSVCKNETSKKVLEAVILKSAKFIENIDQQS